ncbi:hypothetical protein [Micromonospora aurantiaca (nom. illeg.)]|uniref:hypothetical protein n=1 Tax=Micromonospora aurantiaca (nom. illeg.) TaxID=47850 RepID=UPI00082821AF|nr:hypothetical protein [Micromonospora aurantiaca]SCL21254.1 hypothetical protein GA0070615_0026 [Micromonospora aurantiaca]SCL21389.1 hypothetical protein GA0070615_0060 [Micromonospora aurantiaca]
MARREHGPVLDWRHCAVADDQPCVICGRPTPLRSPAGKPCHKTCAEAWIASHQK